MLIKPAKVCYYKRLLKMYFEEGGFLFIFAAGSKR
jgi:hypothetical protein